MKKLLLGAVLFGVLFGISGCAAGFVNDKRAPGDPGHKTFEIQVDRKDPDGSHEVWVKVPEHVWDRCRMGAPYPQCAG